MDFKEIKRVLLIILVLNWLVASAKIFIGISTGTIILSILTDGLHSLFDGVTNLIGFFGIKLAERPADKGHPYGHRKYETITSMMILFFLAITAYEVGKNAFQKLFHPSAINIEWFVFGVLAACIFIDWLVARYEYKKGVGLKSIILKADSSHTKSHYITTGAVLLAAVLIKLGLPAIVDPIFAIFVVGFIIKLGFEIFKETTAVLADKALASGEKIKEIAEKIQEVESCHGIRSRGDESYVFVDFHLVLKPDTPLAEAHEICEKMKEIIRSEMPDVKDIIIQLEPNDKGCNPS